MSRLFVATVLTSFLLFTARPMPLTAASTRTIVIQNVTLISPERSAPLLHVDVLVRQGCIVEIGPHLTLSAHSKVIDGRGRFLIPGLIDSHVHLGRSAALDEAAIKAHPELSMSYRAQLPRAYLAFGFTSVVDLDLTPPDREWFEASPRHPRLYSCGGGIKVAGGYMAFDLPAPSSPSFPNLVYEPKEAQHWPKSLSPDDYTAARAVARAANSGSVCIKAFVEPGFGMFHWPYLHRQTLDEIRAASSKRNLPLMVHANSIDSWREALEAHADVIAHGLWVWPGDPGSSVPPPAAEDVIAAVAHSSTHVQPTLQTVAGESAMIDPRLLNDPRLAMALPADVIAYLRSAEGVKARLAVLEQYRQASPPPGFGPLLKAAIQRTQATFKFMLQDRVSLIFGSDTPGVDGFGNPPGLNGRLEIENWAQAGAPLSLILRAATLDNAAALRLAGQLGSIEVGKKADLLLLERNPLESVSAYDSIELIFLNGEPIRREWLHPPDLAKVTRDRSQP